MPLAITFGGLALLFQPFFKIALGRTMWNTRIANSLFSYNNPASSYNAAGFVLRGERGCVTFAA